jgi:prephenate dehydrogenase
MKIAVIGGYGKMGRWLTGYLRTEGHQVFISGRDENKLKETAAKFGAIAATLEQAVKISDVIILSVPINAFESTVKETANFTSDKQFIFDVTSIKAKPVEIMHQYITKGTILGIHPMFGPGASGIQNQRFVLTPTNEIENTLAEKVRGYLEKRDCLVQIMSPSEHDEMMSIVLGLSHFIALVTADTFQQMGKLKEAGNVSGTTYKMLITVAQAVASEDPDFYSSLQMNLPNMEKIERLFLETAGKWQELVQNKDRQEFINKMHKLREGFSKEGTDLAGSYEQMYKLLGQ